MRDLRRRDLDFYLYDLFDLERLTADGPFAGQTRETWDSVLDTAHRIAAEKFEPIAAELDEYEPSWDGRRVHLPERLSEAIAAFNDAGFVAAAFPEAVGGLGLPYSVFQAVMATFSAANVAAVAYPLLTTAAANLIATHGSSAQRAAYVEPMLSGRFFGTMCLSETQAGSSLADIRTVAQPLSGDDYAIRGSKMWISGGEHELSENIVHLVLARLPDAPAGIRGISLFIVPRFRLDTGASNDVQLAGLNHKMGYRGTVNTVLNFGENNACVGQIVGRPNEGLAYMFHMMNEARIGVGLGANMLGYAGYRHSLAYARQRPQGRPLTDKSPESPQVPIMQHADVRRMLLAQKSLVEGGMALSFYCARLVDEMRLEEDAATKRRLLDFLTPLAKSWPSEFALEANKLAIQVLGGYGYTRDYPVERLYRDNRLNPIHEGTHGIQALDLLGRKVFGDQGQTLRDLAAVIGQDIEAATHTELAPWAEQLDAALGSWLRTTAVLGERAATGRIDTALANAHEYLCLAGHTVVAWLWLRQVMCVSDDSSEFAQGKRAAMRYFFARELPRTATWAQILTSFESSPLDLSDDGF